MERHLVSWKRMLEQKPTRNQPRSPTSHDAISRQTCNNLGLHRCRHKSFQLCCHQNPGPIPEISQHAIHTFYRMKKCKKESSFVNLMCSSARYSIHKIIIHLPPKTIIKLKHIIHPCNNFTSPLGRNKINAQFS
jgi:hypothetical protein